MEINEYRDFVRQSWRGFATGDKYFDDLANMKDLFIATSGFGEEAGEVLGGVKEKIP